MLEKLIYKGVWFLPDNPEKQISGTLIFDPIDGIDLELLGILKDERSGKEIDEPNFILGFTTDGMLITLYKCYEYTRSMSFPGIETCSYSSLYILIGDHYANEQEFVFHKINARFKNLDEWISKFGFNEVALDRKNHKVSINYELPSSIDFKVNETLHGKLNFTFTTPISKFIQKAIIEQKSEVILEVTKAKPFFKLLNDLMLFQNFLTLGTFEPTYPLSITIINNDRKEEDFDSLTKSMNVIYKPGFNFKDGKRKRQSEFLFSYNDLTPNFEIIIKKWFSLSDKIEPVTNLLFESFYFSGKFNQNRFLNIVQALETFHRRFRKNEILQKEEHGAMIKEIINSATEKFKGWLQERLNFSNEPTLHHRLVELLNEVSNTTVDKIIGDKDQFIKDTKNSRNYYTHYDKSIEKKALKKNQLYLLSEKLRVVLITILLLEVGFTKEQIENLFKRNEFKFFNHIMEKAA